NVKKDIGHNLDFECDENGNYERVACSCGARGPVVAYTKQSIIDGWNTRSEPKHETVEQWEKEKDKIIYELDFQVGIAQKYNEKEYERAYKKAKEIVLKHFNKTENKC
ncbi:MAG: hypothetical protein GY793_00605, partial [Proteobacteria bacterium]|nr:hypothetical protein [Pseudomonadota bacterium]